jgi:hypothetical protein
VIAYRLPSDDQTQPEMQPRITSSGGQLNRAALSDGDVNDVAVLLPAAAAGSESWIQFEYPRAQTVQSVTLATLNDMISIFDFDDPVAVFPRLEASSASNWRRASDVGSRQPSILDSLHSICQGLGPSRARTSAAMFEPVRRVKRLLGLRRRIM